MWTLCDIYLDFRSGSTIAGRTEFMRLLDDAANRKFDIVLCKSISRFGRNVTEALQMIKLLHQSGVHVIFEQENLDSSDPEHTLLISITATIALNLIIQGVINAGAVNIYITPFEHNAVTRVLHPYLDAGRIKLHQLSVTDSFEYDIVAIQNQFAANAPDFVIVSHVSNTIGLIAPAEDIFYCAKKYNAITLLDMAQSAGLISCNVGLETIDYAVFAGHKTLLGPTGISGFVMKPNLKLEPILFGGTGYESASPTMQTSVPERFEIGTINAGGIAGLNAALKWIEEIGIDNIRAVEEEKRQRLLPLIITGRIRWSLS